MARNPFGFLSFVSPKQKEREQRAYEKWALPYGEPQRQKLLSLLKELYPSESPQMALTAFLSGKAIYTDKDGDYEDTPEEFDPIAATHFEITTYFVKKKSVDVYPYIALIEADIAIDEQLAYPTAEELLERAKVLKQTRA